MDALGQLLFLALIFGGFYLLAIRPQRARLRAVAQVQASLGEGQRVVTTSGLFGTIRSVDAETVLIEIAPGVEVTFARAAVLRPADDADAT